MSLLQWAIAFSSFAVCAVVLWQLKHQKSSAGVENEALGYARIALFVFAAWRGADALNAGSYPGATWPYALFALTVALVLGLQGKRK